MNPFKVMRKRKGISQRELGEILHVTQVTISQWETGKCFPDTKLIIQLCDMYGVSADYLLGRTPVPLTTVSSETPFVETTAHEKQVLDAYKAASEQEQIMVCRLLQVEHPATNRAKTKNA